MIAGIDIGTQSLKLGRKLPSMNIITNNANYFYSSWFKYSQICDDITRSSRGI